MKTPGETGNGWKAAVLRIVGALVVAAVVAVTSAFVTYRLMEYRIEQAEEELDRLKERSDLSTLLERLARAEARLDEGGRFTREDFNAYDERHERQLDGLVRRIERLEGR